MLDNNKTTKMTKKLFELYGHTSCRRGIELLLPQSQACPPPKEGFFAKQSVRSTFGRLLPKGRKKAERGEVVTL